MGCKQTDLPCGNEYIGYSAKRLNFRPQNKYESKERHFRTKWTEENVILRVYLDPLSTVSHAF